MQVMVHPDRARTEVDTPRRRGDVTQIVSPLPIGDPVASRRYLYLGVIATTALGVAIAIMLTGRRVDGATAPPAEPAAVATPTPPTLEKVSAPVVEHPQVDPIVEPTHVVDTKPARRPARRPKAVARPTPKNPAWDPDALFLKPPRK